MAGRLQMTGMGWQVDGRWRVGWQGKREEERKKNSTTVAATCELDTARGPTTARTAAARAELSAGHARRPPRAASFRMREAALQMVVVAIHIATVPCTDAPHVRITRISHA